MTQAQQTLQWNHFTSNQSFLTEEKRPEANQNLPIDGERTMVVIEIDKKELTSNNLKTLRLRKKEFEKSLTHYVSIAGYVFIVLLYLKNTSFIRFIVRFGLHSLLENPFPKSNELQILENMKKQATKMFFSSIIFTNIVFLAIDLIVGVPISSDETPNVLFGSITLQVIGEKRPTSRLVYIYYNLMIFMLQFVLLYVSMLLKNEVDDPKNNEPISGSIFSINQIEGDGYTGLTTIATIKPIEIYHQVRNLDIVTTDDTESEITRYEDYMHNRMSQLSMV